MQVDANQPLPHLMQHQMNEQEKELRVVLLGPPGCGKGTQAANIRDTCKSRHLSTGDMLRDAISSGARSGAEANQYMLQGQLVPDSIVNRIVFDAILATSDGEDGCNGFILDGFPRNVAQAGALDEMLRVNEMPLDAAIEFAIDDSVLRQRILGRLVHPASGRTYHTIFHPPRNPMQDDITGEKLIRRPDDNERTLGRRLATYRKETKPVIDYYDRKGILRTVDAGKESQVVWKELRALFEAPEGRRQSR